MYKRQRSAIATALIFCLIITAGVCVFAAPLMTIFVDPSETEIIAIGVQYLRIEGACYCGIGCLFLLYGLYRGIGKPFMSLVLTVISLGTRVGLAYLLAPIDVYKRQMLVNTTTPDGLRVGADGAWVQ